MLKLGKLPPKHHPNTLRLGKYLGQGILPSPATKVYREYLTPESAKLMFGNDQYGDCVWAMFANFIILTTVHTGSLFVPTLVDVLKCYSDVTGFDPATGANDNGTNMTDAMAYMQSTGMAGHKILGWARVDHTNLNERRLGADLFGATLTGVNFPESADTQFNSASSWEIDPSSPIAGGHAILRPGYGAAGDDYVTWAKWDQKASAAWSFGYVDEEYVAITEDWFDAVTKLTPGGLDLLTLEADLKLLAV